MPVGLQILTDEVRFLGSSPLSPPPRPVESATVCRVAGFLFESIPACLTDLHMSLADLPNDHQCADLELALRYVDRFNVALDCGAHRGILTRQLAKRFQSVTAIEPSELADLITGATVIKAAVGDKPGRCSMKHGTENTGQRHVITGDDTDIITIDSLNLAPDFIKLDVEGMEYHAIIGGEETIRTHKPVIMFEENGLNQRYGIADGAVAQLLESWGAVRMAVLNKDHVFKWPR